MSLMCTTTNPVSFIRVAKKRQAWDSNPESLAITNRKLARYHYANPPCFHPIPRRALQYKPKLPRHTLLALFTVALKLHCFLELHLCNHLSSNCPETSCHSLELTRRRQHQRRPQKRISKFRSHRLTPSLP